MCQMQTLIDPKRIDDLLDDISTEDLDEIVQIFIEETAAMIAALRTAPAGELAAMIHGVKGSADSLGLRDLAGLCREAEWALARGEPADLDGIDRSFERSCEALLERLSGQMRNSDRVVSSVMSV